VESIRLPTSLKQLLKHDNPSLLKEFAIEEGAKEEIFIMPRIKIQRVGPMFNDVFVKLLPASDLER
jgi:hypothetical protein